MSAKVKNPGYLQPGRIEGFDDLLKQIDRIALWGRTEKQKEVRKIHVEVANIGKKSVRKAITNHKGTIKVRRSGKLGGKRGPSYDIEKGTLKRSIRVFNVMYSKTSVMVGPRSGVIDRTLRGPQDGALIRNDGYFAHFVNEGDLPQHMGGRGAYNGPNRGFFERGMRPAIPQMTAKLIELYRLHFDKYVTK